jgi:hypothetical protein
VLASSWLSEQADLACMLRQVGLGQLQKCQYVCIMPGPAQTPACLPAPCPVGCTSLATGASGDVLDDTHLLLLLPCTVKPGPAQGEPHLAGYTHPCCPLQPALHSLHIRSAIKCTCSLEPQAVVTPCTIVGQHHQPSMLTDCMHTPSQGALLIRCLLCSIS